jgi:cellulose synthase/poly-beta-1,6-N-acetylglucosamine synthase-like glycosyltransferase
MKISVIISFYKNIPALELILLALAKQTYDNFEVIVSEDDNNNQTTNFITEQQPKYAFKIIHLNQLVDDGFRKNQMLNKSLKAASGEMIVFLDGDCIPHPLFLKSYLKHVKENTLCFGRRVMVDEATTKRIYNTKSIQKLNFISLLFTKTTHLKYALYIPFLTKLRAEGIWGCNVGVFKKHLLDINGFDQDYITAGVGEDVDLEWRLTAIGVKFKSIRFEALEFHLHHKENYNRTAIETGLAQLKLKKEANLYFCKNGLTLID